MITVLVETAANGLVLPGIMYSTIARTLYCPGQGTGTQRLGWLENQTLVPFSCSAIHTKAILVFVVVLNCVFIANAVTFTWLADVKPAQT